MIARMTIAGTVRPGNSSPSARHMTRSQLQNVSSREAQNGAATSAL